MKFVGFVVTSESMGLDGAALVNGLVDGEDEEGSEGSVDTDGRSEEEEEEEEEE